MQPDKSFTVEAIKEYLKILESRGLLTYTRNGRLIQRIKERRKVNMFFGKSKAPDFFLFLRGGKTIHLHVPKKYEKLSKSQSGYRDRLISLGHIYETVKSVQDVEIIIKRYII